MRTDATVVTAHLTTQVHKFLAVLSIVSRRAGTSICSKPVSAGPSILTWLGVTLVLLVFTKRAVKTRTAAAGEGVYVVNTGPIIQTRALGAFQDVVFTKDAVKARSTFTHETVDIVLAEGSILARMAGALIHIGLTPLSLESQAAFAGEGPDVIDTGAATEARIGRAVVNIDLADLSTIARLTIAYIAPLAVYAAATVFARVFLAFVHILIAAWSLPTSRTLTGVRRVVCRWSAHSSFLTRMRSAGDLFHLAVLACERQTAVAGVTVYSICADALVQTWPRGTLVYILLTVHSSEPMLAPAGIAVVSIQTGPPILAWIWLALILLYLTVLPHPAGRTLADVVKLLFNALPVVHTRLASTMVGP